jgi:hypothetical protein
MNKLDTLVSDWGFSNADELVENYLYDGLMPGICMNECCDYSTEYEPDQDAGWCEECGSHSVKSAAVLLGVI